MKQLFTILFMLVSGVLLWAQESQLFTSKEVVEMAVFPGCEKINASDKKEMNNCLSQQLSGLLAEKLTGFDQVMEQNGISSAISKIQFVISKEGIIIDIHELKGSNPLLAEAAINALNQISEELPPIRPAKLKKGTPVNIVYQLPVRYQIELPEIQETALAYPVDEIVLFTLLDEDLRYEIRLFKDKDIKAYEIRDGLETYLGKFLSLGEVERSEPYQSLINRERDSDKTLVADGFLDDGFFEIYIHNLFDRGAKKPVYVEVVKVDDKKRTSVSKYEKEAEFNRSRYAPLIYRD